jgi:hypothetical protein
MFAPTARPGLFSPLANLLATRSGRNSSIAADGTDTDRDRRDFVMGMLDRNMAAFASEADVTCMMHCYPGRF